MIIRFAQNDLKRMKRQNLPQLFYGRKIRVEQLERNFVTRYAIQRVFDEFLLHTCANKQTNKSHVLKQILLMMLIRLLHAGRTS